MHATTRTIFTNTIAQLRQARRMKVSPKSREIVRDLDALRVISSPPSTPSATVSPEFPAATAGKKQPLLLYFHFSAFDTADFSAPLSTWDSSSSLFCTLATKGAYSALSP